MSEIVIIEDKEIVVSDEVLLSIPTGSGNLNFERTGYSFLGVAPVEKKALTEIIESKGGIVIPPGELTTYLICIPDKAKNLPYWDEAKRREEQKTIYLMTPFLFRLWADENTDFEMRSLDERIAAADHFLKHRRNWAADKFNLIPMIKRFIKLNSQAMINVLFENGSDLDVKRLLDYLLEEEKVWVDEGFSDGFYTYSIVNNLSERVAEAKAVEKITFYLDYKNFNFPEEMESDYEMHRLDVDLGLESNAKVYYSVGSQVLMGRYYINSPDRTERIKWEVIENDGEKILLFPIDILDIHQYNEEFKCVTWENCTLRRWLNEEFLNTVFSDEEKKKILEVTVDNPGNLYRKTAGGNPTSDKLFLLNDREAIRYTTGYAQRSKRLTPYAKSKGGWYDAMGCGWWWLRTPGFSPDRAVSVTNDGSAGGGGNKVNSKDDGICPAFWVEIESLANNFLID